jgi:hypothetical protein
MPVLAGVIDLLVVNPLCVVNMNRSLALRPPSDRPIQDPVQSQSGLGRLRNLVEVGGSDRSGKRATDENRGKGGILRGSHVVSL